MNIRLIRAKQLDVGMIFKLFQTKFTITHVIDNLNDGVVVRFMTDNNDRHDVYRMVVPRNFMFNILI